MYGQWLTNVLMKNMPKHFANMMSEFIFSCLFFFFGGGGIKNHSNFNDEIFNSFIFSYLLRMKEWERERRLMERRERIAKKKAREVLAA